MADVSRNQRDATRVLYAALDPENAFATVEELRAFILNEWENGGERDPRREKFLGGLRDALVQAINGNPITVADAWDLLREWDKATGTRGDIPNVKERA